MPSARTSKASRGRPVRPSASVSPAAVTAAMTLLLTVLVFVCWWPLARYYLAQDDFILLERASHGFEEAMSPFFNLRPGQFRPLTKGLYFLFAWPAFGLNPVPYHIVSLLLHALNSVLVGLVLRRLGVSVLVSWLGAVVFAVHMGHLEAIAWASCIQQLAGATFAFAALLFGLDALSRRKRRPALMAAVAYALALGCYEQTLATPLVLIAWLLLQRGWREAWRATRGAVLPMLLVLGVYVAYVFGLRGMPESGPYVMGVGTNVLANMRDYTGLAFSLWHVYPAYGIMREFTFANAAWIGVVTLHLVLRSYRALLFGGAAFIAFLAPVMFTTAHTHSFHLYVPAIGIVFLLASAADAIRRVAGQSRQRTAAAVMILAAIVMAGGSMRAVRENTRGMISEDIQLPRITVLRRSVLAERVCRELRSEWTGESWRLILRYPSPKLVPNWRNVQSALGNGSAVRLALGRPDLEVVFAPPVEMPGNAKPEEVMFFTELGYCYTYEEWQAYEIQLERTGP